MKPTRIIKSHSVSNSGHSAPIGPHAGHGPAVHPIVKMIRNGDLLESLEIACPCGEVIVIDCLYDAASEIAS